MASIITIAGEQLFAQKAQNNQQLDIDTFIFANVPGQDAAAPIARDEAMPNIGQQVHTQIVQQVGRINDNVVVYSTVLDSVTGDFDFNWVGLYSSVNDTLVAINHIPTTTKTATNGGVAGNTLNRNFGIEYSGIAELTGITVAPETWQLDFTARLAGMDELTRQLASDMNGKDWFIDNGFKISPRATVNTFDILPGVGYVNGLRIEQAQEHIITVQNYPQFVYVDAYFDGDASSAWKPLHVFTVTDSEMNDYIDINGKQHFIVKLAVINTAENVEDLRSKNSIKERLDKQERNNPTDNYWATVEQKTSYTMPLSRHIFGEEYLWGFHKQILDSKNTNQNKIIHSGDSAVKGDNANGFAPSQLGAVIGTRLGLAKADHINAGHSGKSAVDWGGWYVDIDINAHPDMNVYITRWGINDGSEHGDVKTYLDAMEQGLTALRNFKEVESLAIVVMAPSAAYDEGHNRSTEWFEAIIPELRKLCRKYRATFFDTYAIWQDARQGAKAGSPRWLDDPFGDGRGIHPDAAFNHQIVSRVMRMLLVPIMDGQNLASNGLINTHPDQFKPSVNVSPSSYGQGITIWGVDDSGGWPINGKLITHRNGTKIIQTIYSQEEDGVQTQEQKTLTMRRFGDANLGSWSKFYNKTAQAPTLNGWTVTAGRVPKYKHTETGLCVLQGTVGGGVDGTTALEVPKSMWPLKARTFKTSGDGVDGGVVILPTGEVQVFMNGGLFVHLDGVIWLAGD